MMLATRPSESGNASRRISTATHELKEINAVEDSSIGASATGNPEVRHDGVVLSYVAPGGPADQAGLKPGDVILAIGDRFLFTANEATNVTAEQCRNSAIKASKAAAKARTRKAKELSGIETLKHQPAVSNDVVGDEITKDLAGTKNSP